MSLKNRVLEDIQGIAAVSGSVLSDGQVRRFDGKVVEVYDVGFNPCGVRRSRMWASKRALRENFSDPVVQLSQYLAIQRL